MTPSGTVGANVVANLILDGGFLLLDIESVKQRSQGVAAIHGPVELIEKSSIVIAKDLIVVDGTGEELTIGTDFAIIKCLSLRVVVTILERIDA